MAKWSTNTRFSLSALLGGVAGSAIAFAVLRYLWPLWPNPLSIVVLSVGLVAGVISHGHRRVFWLGFSMLGWAYILLAFGYHMVPKPSDGLEMEWIVAVLRDGPDAWRADADFAYYLLYVALVTLGDFCVTMFVAVAGGVLPCWVVARIHRPASHRSGTRTRRIQAERRRTRVAIEYRNAECKWS